MIRSGLRRCQRGFMAKFAVATAAGAALTGCSVVFAANKPSEKSYTVDAYPKGHKPRPDLPTFEIAEIKKHTSKETRIWCTYKGAVYDVTDMAHGHPGGYGRLCMAGGNDLAIFWDVYRQHYQEHILGWIEKFRIGNVTPEDAIKQETEFVFQNPFKDDPVRPNPDYLMTTLAPFNGEPVLERMGENFYTPNDLFYVRLHMPVQWITADDWEMTVEGFGVKETKITLKDIKQKFEHHELACTLQCVGNRRHEFHYNDMGDLCFTSPKWRTSALSNGSFKGVYLRDVLKYCGLDVDKLHHAEFPDEKIRHVHIEGWDETEDGVNYGISIPIEKAVDPRGDCMICWEMNGEPLPPDHGYPVRHLCPGHVGNKSTKFLKRIRISDVETKKPWHFFSYRNFAPDLTFEDKLHKWEKLTEDELFYGTIPQWMPVQSLITFPPPNAVIGGKLDSIYVRGCSWTGQGVGMARVDVSLDGGKHFTGAKFLPKPDEVAKRETWRRKWSWYIFEKEIPLPEEVKKKLQNGQRVTLDLVSKGVDNAFNVQPSDYRGFYNARAVVVNNWYHVPVTIDPRKDKGYIERVTDIDLLNPPSGGKRGYAWQQHGWTAPEAKWHEEIMAKYGKKD